VQDADYVVLGTKPGPKKMQEINDAGIKTMSEAEFMQRIHGGSTSTSEPPKKKLKT
jgi:BRCT domain type II-containing protein